MDKDNHPPNKIDKPPAHVFSDKEFDERFNQIFVEKKPSNDFYADDLGAITSIHLPGAWTVRSRNKRVGVFQATAFVQKDKVVSHSSGPIYGYILPILKAAPHSLSETEIDSAKVLEDKREIVDASTFDLEGKRVLQVSSQASSGASKIELYFAAGTLFPDNAEKLCFESRGKLASLQKDVDLAKKTLHWNTDRWPPTIR